MRENDEAELSVSSALLDSISPAEVSIAESLMSIHVFVIERGPYLRWVKATLDFFLGLFALVLATPLLLGIGGALRFQMGSPVVLRQKRMGRFNIPFTLYKFRTMEPDRRAGQISFVGQERRLTHKSPSDPRITQLGGWLRSTRLDELPQLLNVVKGDLSLVGPRPELVEVAAAHYKPWQYRRHAVKPGLTGIWQVKDTGEQLLHDCTEMELAYLDQVSLTTDLKIIMQTIPVMFRRRGI